MAQHISHPTIIQKAQTKAGEEVMIDDYRDAYFWLRDNTPKDARVIMAWWDYGYQITAVSWMVCFAVLYIPVAINNTKKALTFHRFCI